MIKFPDLEKVFIQKKDCSYTEFGGKKRIICPYCKDHKQTDTGDCDCKEVIYKDELVNGKLEVYGQCCCYSEKHRNSDN